MLLAVGGAALAATSGTPDAGTVQTNGQVSAILVAGGKTYLGGHFTKVNGVERNRLAAVDTTTGQLTDWNPNANSIVRSLAVSTDGTRVYAGGDFSAVGGNARQRLAAIDTSTGAVDPAWKPTANATVRALTVSGNRLYLGGGFSKVNGQSRTRLALVDASTGALSLNWAPTLNDSVWSLGSSGDGTRLYVGGPFTNVNGQSKSYLAALSTNTGALDSTFKSPTPNGSVYDLEVSGGRVYTAESGAGGAAAAYNTSTGIRAWSVRGDGNAQAIAVLGEKVYVGGHFNTFGGLARRHLAALNATTGGLDLSWAPSASGSCGAWIPSTCRGDVWALTADPPLGRLYTGGDFRRVSGAEHAGFARFSEE